MALSLDQLTALTHRYIVPKLFDNIFDSNPLLQRILKGGQYQSVSGGTYIDVPLNYAKQTSAGWFSGNDTLATADSDNLTAARFSWCNLYAAISLTEEDILKNGGDAGVIKLLASKSQIAEETIRDYLGTGLYSDGTDSKSIVGLRDIVAVDQTVGGISQTTSSWHQGQVDSTTTTLTISALNTQFEAAAIGSSKPSVIVGTRANYNRFYNLLQPAQRFFDSSTANAGFQSLMFNGVPFISDSHCPTAHIFGINEKELHLFYHPEMNFSVDPFQSPINSRVRTGRICWMGALGSSNNRKHFKLSGITA